MKNNEDEVFVESEGIASVIVAKSAKSLDKLFDYAVPKQLLGRIQIGSHIAIPFGARNMLTEGYVFALKNQTEVAPKSVKRIDSLIDTIQAFDEKGAELIAWLREKTLCSYIEAVRVLIPTGSSAAYEQWVHLRCSDAKLLDAAAGKSEQKRSVLDLLIKENGQMELYRLLSSFEQNVRPAVTALEKQNVISVVQTESGRMRERTVRFATLAVSCEELERQEDEIKRRAPRQYEILNILRCNESVPISDLLHMAKAGYQSINALHQQGLVEFLDKTVRRDPIANRSIPGSVPLLPTEEQKQALDTLLKAAQSECAHTFLLHGITGSGKTEVYMQLIGAVIEKKRTAIVLVPEISLTPLMTKRFVSRFGDRVAILHSGLSLGERFDEWNRIKRGEVDVVVGARSAVFAPLDRIGVLIVDEEHESTYKSETAPRYHARDVALFRASQHNAITILASATPSVESYYKAQNHIYHLLEMTNRYNRQQLPTVTVVDMRKELQQGNRSMFSRLLSRELQSNAEREEQSILLLNRRGFSTFVSCRACGYVAKCPHCNISLTYHRNQNQLMCHYCGYTQENLVVCPSCHSRYIRYFGAGTQRLEEELKRHFTGLRCIRMDVDTTATKCAHERILDEFENGDIDVLIGTQMVSKGLDFHNVTLVGVMAADTALYMDDFRGAERTFSLITQVSGRAGRGEKTGRAIVQTYTPDHAAIVYAKDHDYRGFYHDEIKLREAMWYPPFCEIVSILITGAAEHMVQYRAREIAEMLRSALSGERYGRVQILGPAAAAISKIRDKYRFRILIKCENADILNDVLKEVLEDQQLHKQRRFLSLSIDKNPEKLL